MLLLQLMQADKIEIFQRRLEQRLECQALPFFVDIGIKSQHYLKSVFVCLFVYYLLVAARSIKLALVTCNKNQQ